MHASHPAVAAVLAGGRGARLGGAKAAALLARDTLISYPLQAALDAGLEALVVAKPETGLPTLPAAARVVHEPQRRHHPLAGVVAALRDTAERRPPTHPVLVLACDMPFLTAELLVWLASRPGEEPVATSAGGRLTPFPCLLRPLHAGALEAALEREISMRSALESLAARVVTEAELARFGEPGELCANVNEPRDLAAAAASLAAAAASLGR